jgi:NAD(P)-dependent dehydrogenase (short-subunit alcohol dehydrogenase family)
MATAVVTGASRGVGLGVATGLAHAGYTVFATGRTVAHAALPESVRRIPTDHRDDAQTAAAFERVAADVGVPDVLVNSCWGGYERMVENGAFTWTAPFWKQPMHRWTSMIDAGVRAAFVASSHAARAMVPTGRGLIVNISFWPAQKYVGNALYGIAKAATDKFTRDAAHELRPHGVSVVSVYPGLVRTESVLAAAREGWLDLSNSESPEFIGRVVAALAQQPDLAAYSGQVVVAAEFAARVGVTDIDGRQPAPLTLQSV